MELKLAYKSHLVQTKIIQNWYEKIDFQVSEEVILWECFSHENISLENISLMSVSLEKVTKFKVENFGNL